MMETAPPIPMEETEASHISAEESTVLMNDENMSSDALALKRRLEQRKVSLLKARAALSVRQRVQTGAEEQLYGEEGRRDQLAKERNLTFLNMSTLRTAMQFAQSNHTLTEALGLEKESNIGLQTDEVEYVRNLLEEKADLAGQLFRQQQEGVERELELVSTRAELAQLHCETRGLLEETLESRSESESGDQETVQLKKKLEEGDYKVNQIRFTLQKFMISHDNLGQLFDAERNAELRDLFLRCGKTPTQLREEYMERGGTSVAPAAAADLGDM